MQLLKANSYRHVLWKAQYLIEGWVVGNQVQPDQIPTRPGQSGPIDSQATGQGGIAIVREAMTISDRDQKQIKRPGGDISLFDGVFTDQAVIEPTEMLGHLAQAFRVQDPLGRIHIGLFECPARVVSAGSGQRRCHLVTCSPEDGKLGQ